MGVVAYEAAVYAAFALPWIAVPLAAVLAFRAQPWRAALGALLLCAGGWIGFYILVFQASGGKMTGGPSGAVVAAQGAALRAFALALLAIALVMAAQKLRGGRHG